ncbi:MAG: HTH domain-containing protein [Polyangiaceae bacterium]
MTFTEAAAEVLRLAGKPMHYKEITELAIEKNLLSHVGKSPEVTMGARLAALLKKEDKGNPIVRVKPGVFALREWSDKKGKKGAAKESQADVAADDNSAADVNALEVEAAARRASEDEDGTDEDGEDRPAMSGEDALRRDLAASAADLFDDEDDDDQPILAAPASSANAAAPGSADAAGEGGRRRRRRRRRGRGGNGQGEFADRASSRSVDGVIQPQAIVSLDGDSSIDGSRDPLAPAPRPMVRERHQIMGGAPVSLDAALTDGDELAGRELADAAALVLSASDRNAGPVPLRTVVDALLRRGRLSGDAVAASIQLSASIRADNLRRQHQSMRPRFRFAGGGRVALTDWLLGNDLTRLEQDVIAAVERYRDGARRVMLRRVQELPGHAFVELALVALERIGMTQVKAVRRAGSPGGEAHFLGVHKTGADEIRTAIVIRKDGREIGRERVTDLRGALHHYGPATAGWLVTTGQVLSGAREEAQAPGAAPVALYDGLSFCRLLEDSDVAVVKTRFPIAIPDLELLESMRG